MLSILKRSLKFWLSVHTSFTSSLVKILYWSWRLFQYILYTILLPCTVRSTGICAIYVDLYLRFSSFYKKSQQEQQQQQQQQQEQQQQQQQQLLNL